MWNEYELLTDSNFDNDGGGDICDNDNNSDNADEDDDGDEDGGGDGGGD